MPIDDDSDDDSNLEKKRTREDDENGDGGRPKKVVCWERILEDGKTGGPGRECARCIHAGRSCKIARDEEGQTQSSNTM
ncbi:hypothetical protein AN958_11381 [Leucoagaricus sp. SymC.cos]|nr:hypothetical protein AN958_11381 [Leucoagaricus sp. SymC.cos]